MAGIAGAELFEESMGTMSKHFEGQRMLQKKDHKQARKMQSNLFGHQREADAARHKSDQILNSSRLESNETIANERNATELAKANSARKGEYARGAGMAGAGFAHGAMGIINTHQTVKAQEHVAEVAADASEKVAETQADATKATAAAAEHTADTVYANNLSNKVVSSHNPADHMD